MKIVVKRSTFNGTNTIGRMYIDGKFFAHTLEDVYRELKSENDKIYGKTAIPYGTYEVIVSFSNRFQKDLPELLKVPFFIKIRLHGGNTDKDTEGCILVGANTDEKKIWNCGNKVKELTELIRNAKGPVTITVEREHEPVKKAA